MQRFDDFRNRFARALSVPVDGHETISRRRERQAVEGAHHALPSSHVRHVAGCAVLGHRDASIAADDELHLDTAAERRVRSKRVLVARAVATLVHANDALDDFLGELALPAGLHPGRDAVKNQ
jgi:hypothetical protein